MCCIRHGGITNADVLLCLISFTSRIIQRVFRTSQTTAFSHDFMWPLWRQRAAELTGFSKGALRCWDRLQLWGGCLSFLHEQRLLLACASANKVIRASVKGSVDCSPLQKTGPLRLLTHWSSYSCPISGEGEERAERRPARQNKRKIKYWVNITSLAFWTISHSYKIG